MKHKHLIVVTALLFAFGSPAFAQRGHGGGPPPGHGSSDMENSRGSESNANTISHTDMSHASPSDVLSHNTAIAGKIQTLTGEKATTACDGFKNLGRCVAAAHVAKNLSFAGGFDALKAKITGPGSVSLGQAISSLAPKANAKAEVKKANKQASDDMKDAESNS